MKKEVRWLTAAFDNMQGFRLWEYKWDQKTWKSEHIPKVFIWTAEDKGIMESFFKAYRKDTDENVWNAIDRFQDKVKAERLEEKHRKVLAPIDLRMEPIGEPSQDFTDWVWEHGMSFSRYGIYKETSKGKVSVLQNSKTNAYCKKMYEKMKKNGKGFFPVTVKDLVGNEKFSASTGWITKPASKTYGKAQNNREWEIVVADGAES